jgi:hypothetical protein
VAAHWARIAKTVAQRDDLLAALERMMEFEEEGHPECGCTFCVARQAARAAIARAMRGTP